MTGSGNGAGAGATAGGSVLLIALLPHKHHCQQSTRQQSRYQPPIPNKAPTAPSFFSNR